MIKNHKELEETLLRGIDKNHEFAKFTKTFLETNEECGSSVDETLEMFRMMVDVMSKEKFKSNIYYDFGYKLAEKTPMYFELATLLLDYESKGNGKAIKNLLNSLAMNYGIEKLDFTKMKESEIKNIIGDITIGLNSRGMELIRR